MKPVHNRIASSLEIFPIGSIIQKISIRGDRRIFLVQGYGNCDRIRDDRCLECVTNGTHYILEHYGTACPGKKDNKIGVIPYWRIVE